MTRIGKEGVMARVGRTRIVMHGRLPRGKSALDRELAIMLKENQSNKREEEEAPSLRDVWSPRLRRRSPEEKKSKQKNKNKKKKTCPLDWEKRKKKPRREEEQAKKEEQEEEDLSPRLGEEEEEAQKNEKKNEKKKKKKKKKPRKRRGVTRRRDSRKKKKGDWPELEQRKIEEESSDEDQDQNFKLDGVDESMYNHRITASFVSSLDDPPSKKKLFYDTDFQTHKSTVLTLSPPSTIANLYSAIASLIKESDSKTVSLIKESEERQLSCFRAELNKIREEIKVGDTLGKKSTKENLGTSNQKNDKVSEEDRDGELLFKQGEKNDVQADATCNVTAMEESVGQDEAASKSDGVASKIDFEKHSSDPRADAPAVSKMVEVNLKRRWDFLMEEMEAVRAIQEVQMSDQEKGNEGKGQEMRKKDSKTTRGNKKKDPPTQEVQMSDQEKGNEGKDAEGRDQEPKLNQIIQTLKGLCLQMDANQKANMTEFANLNHRMDAFQKALVQSGLQFPYMRGQTNGSENTPQQADHETTLPLLEP
ncbi:hypothetical protein LWI29_038335 [Acer saccharum]|uniref:Uncharacterized protein n=1 Tax=Acer saccharum TaxID=4024 RepID=A0AA39SPY1_ACESA|nr:hypothetical protein LWI29_038335 [Acer saccharum]